MSDQSSSRTYRKELLLNQLWQSANFLSKAGFLVLLTPLMIAKWGAEGYGVFALASSLLVSMALLDGGVRALTRLRLAEALTTGDDQAYRRAYAEGLFTFASVVGVACLVAAALGATGVLQTLLKLPDGASGILVMTVFLTGFMMITLLGLEPVAARGHLSSLKAANTWGALIAIPLIAATVWLGGSIGLVVFLYSACLIIPNLVVAVQERLFALAPWQFFRRFGVRELWRTLRAGVWFYLTTVALVVKTHALTFLVSALAGPAEAGLFYVLLRLSEIVGNVGATASETSLAALAGDRSKAERAHSFRQSWVYVSIFCLHGALVFALLGDQIIHLWLKAEQVLPRGAGVTLAIFGLTGAFSRVVVNASMGLNLVRPASLANMAEAVLDIVLAGVGYHLAGLPGLFIGGSIGVLFLLIPGSSISELCGQKMRETYLTPLRWLVPGLVLAAAVQFGSGLLPQWYFWFAALGVSGVVALLQLKRAHRGD